MNNGLIDIQDLYALTYAGLSTQDLREFTDWAEYEVMNGNGSEYLLILASLGLDDDLVRETVITYFDLYLRESGREYPNLQVAIVFHYRRFFKRLAFTDSQPALWQTFSSTLSQWYGNENKMLGRVIEYWKRMQRDFVDYYDDDYGYLYEQNPRHAQVSKNNQADYVRDTALRFFRLLDSNDMAYFLLKTS